MKTYINKNKEVKVTSADYKDIVKAFQLSLSSVRSDKELMAWMELVAKSYELSKKANLN